MNSKNKERIFENLPEADLDHPARVTVYYDQSLQPITGKTSEEIWVNPGCPFLFVLNSIFQSYPEIEERYPPGILGFTLNEQVPEAETPVADGSRISFLVPTGPRE